MGTKGKAINLTILCSFDYGEIISLIVYRSETAYMKIAHMSVELAFEIQYSCSRVFKLIMTFSSF